MATDVNRPIAAELAAVLGTLQRRIRRYVFADSVASFLAAASLIVWASVAVDWLFEPARPIRIVLLVIACGGLLLLFARLVIAKVLVRLVPRNLAILLERRFPQLGDRLITVVDSADLPAGRDHPYHGEMLAATQREVVDLVRNLDLDLVFRPRPLVQNVLIAALLSLSVAALAIAQPILFETWFHRAIGLANVAYPRKTRISVQGFDNRAVKVARGSDFQVIAQADTTMRVPQTVQIRYETAGLRDRVAMDREGNATPGREPFQKYTYTFHVLAPIVFDLIGGDDRVDDLRINVVEIPTVDISRTYLACTFPEYLKREPRELPVTGAVSVPRGTAVTVHAACNKPLIAVELADVAKPDAPSRRIAPSPQDPRRFQIPLGAVGSEQTFLVTLHDTDGVHGREPWRLALSAVPDEPPQMALRTHGIGTAITAKARLPISGPINDDHGLARVWCEFAVAEGKPLERNLVPDAGEKTEISLDDAIEVQQLEVKPGQTLQLQFKSRDNCGLESGPNESAGERISLQVVTPEDLRAMLESRELNLRRRFEQLISELTSTRDSLAEIGPGVDSKTEENDPQLADPKDAAPPAIDALPTGDRISAKVLTVERGLQNCRKNADETLGIAVAFDDMHDELVNNRVDTEELKTRLKQAIAQPLHRICEQRFPELDQRLVRSQEALTQDSPAATQAVSVAVQQLDTIVVEMQQVLDKMMEMETFNEVVDMLRSILTSQERLNEETKSQRRQSVRRLLED